MRNLILIFSLVAFLNGGAAAQIISIPTDKIAPVQLTSTKIKDTSGDFIKDNYALNMRIWKVHFTKILFDKENKSLQVAGFASIIMEPIDTFRVSHYKVHLCALRNDSLVNVKHLSREECIDDRDHFDLKIDLERYTVLVFTAGNRAARMFDFSFLLQ